MVDHLMICWFLSVPFVASFEPVALCQNKPLQKLLVKHWSNSK